MHCGLPTVSAAQPLRRRSSTTSNCKQRDSNCHRRRRRRQPRRKAMVGVALLCLTIQRQRPIITTTTALRPIVSLLPAAATASTRRAGSSWRNKNFNRSIGQYGSRDTRSIRRKGYHCTFSTSLSSSFTPQEHPTEKNRKNPLLSSSSSSSPPHYYFPVTAPYPPTGDQPQAIQALVEQLQHHDESITTNTPSSLSTSNPSSKQQQQHRKRGQKYSILRGCTGTGKTLVMAHTVARLGRCKTLVLCHNKTLAAQLARELRTFFDPNEMAVELFVSYYKHYTPESYSETTNRYITKKSAKSDELDALRHLATKALLEASSTATTTTTSSHKSKPTIIVSSVSCIYGLGMPSSYLDATMQFHVGQTVGTLNHLTHELLETTGLYTNILIDKEENENQEDDMNRLVGEGGRDDLTVGQYHLVTSTNSLSSASATIFLWPPTEAFPMRIDLEPTSNSIHNSSNDNDANNNLYQISNISKGHARGMSSVKDITIFPARHFVAPAKDQLEEACRRIQKELQDQVQLLRDSSQDVEADRLLQRVSQDLLLLRETGTCPGIENYSRHMSLRAEGEPPDTLLDYLGFQRQHHQTRTGPMMAPMTSGKDNDDTSIDKTNDSIDADMEEEQGVDDWLLIVDESHVTLPQLKAMYHGDRARKLKLVQHGYRLPSCLDNRPLTNDEFWERVPQTLFVSATPAAQELQWLKEEQELQQQQAEINSSHCSGPIDMMIRPTFVCDPIIEVRPAKGGQLDDLVQEIRAQKANGGHRTLAIALTKRDAEDLADYLVQQGIAATYIHSGLTTLERSQALTAVQEGTVDCLVGVNLLREGIDLPEVSLVCIWNADAEGFLRSETALLQMVGRAARNMQGRAILYANRITDSMRKCIDISAQRRTVQLAYNAKHGKTMKSTKGSSILSIFDLSKDRIQAENERSILDFSTSPSTSTSTTGASTTGVFDPAKVWDGSSDPELELDPVAVPISTRAANSSSVERTIETDHIPSKPGVYFWKDGEGNILYIGKAKRLRSRVKSYLSPSKSKKLNRDTRSIRIRAMLDKAQSVEFVLTPSDRDALLLESNLIKHHQPPYNVLLKDDESYPYICATIGDTYPQFTIAPRRQQGVVASKYRYFGPYPHYSEVHTILQGIEATYDLRGKSFQARHGSTNAAAGREEYKQLFDRVMGEVFSPDRDGGGIPDDDGEHPKPLLLPDADLGLPALRSEYEEASKLFDSPYNDCRDVVAVARVPTDDMSDSSSSTTTLVIHVVQLRKGIVAGSFSYACELTVSSTPEQEEEDFAAAIQTVLERRHYPSGEGSANGHFPFFPDEILIEYPLAETRDLKAAIRAAHKQVMDASSGRLSSSGRAINIRTASPRRPRKETDERALQFARDNAEQVALQKSFSYTPNVAKTSVDGTAMKDLVSLLSLEQEPHRIECYDISHTQGDVAVGSRVVFIDGNPAPKLYRKFNIKTVQGVDDYASLAEVLERRFRRVWNNGAGGLVDKTDSWAMPDLVVIDGGKGQLSAAVLGMAKADVFPRSKQDLVVYSTGDDVVEGDHDLEVMQSSTGRRTTVPIIALAKQNEEVFVHGEKGPVNDSPDSAALLLLRSLRDESHRFALASHRRRRSVLNGH